MTLVQVQRGAAFLDRHDPGWAARVDHWRLDMASATDGILGQLYGYFGRGPGGTIMVGKRRDPVRLGFDLPAGEETAEGYELLTELWGDELEGR